MEHARDAYITDVLGLAAKLLGGVSPTHRATHLRLGLRRPDRHFGGHEGVS